jgi:hypothetical protein
MMKHTLRCHDFGSRFLDILHDWHHLKVERSQNRASPRGVAAKIAAGIVARLANIDILAAPRFALSTIFARNARAFHHARDSPP